MTLEWSQAFALLDAADAGQPQALAALRQWLDAARRAEGANEVMATAPVARPADSAHNAAAFFRSLPWRGAVTPSPAPLPRGLAPAPPHAHATSCRTFFQQLPWQPPHSAPADGHDDTRLHISSGRAAVGAAHEVADSHNPVHQATRQALAAAAPFADGPSQAFFTQLPWGGLSPRAS